MNTQVSPASHPLTGSPVFEGDRQHDHEHHHEHVRHAGAGRQRRHIVAAGLLGELIGEPRVVERAGKEHQPAGRQDAAEHDLVRHVQHEAQESGQHQEVDEDVGPETEKGVPIPGGPQFRSFHGGDTAITVPPRSGHSHRRHGAKPLLPFAFSWAPRGRDGALRPILAQRSAKRTKGWRRSPGAPRIIPSGSAHADVHDTAANPSRRLGRGLSRRGAEARPVRRLRRSHPEPVRALRFLRLAGGPAWVRPSRPTPRRPGSGRRVRPDLHDPLRDHLGHPGPNALRTRARGAGAPRLCRPSLAAYGGDGARHPQSPPGFVPLADTFTQLFYPGTEPFEKDLFFSGHTATLWLMALIATTRAGRLWSGFATLAVGVLVIVQHAHYTIDVIAAPLFAWLAWRLSTVTMRGCGSGA